MLLVWRAQFHGCFNGLSILQYEAIAIAIAILIALSILYQQRLFLESTQWRRVVEVHKL